MPGAEPARDAVDRPAAVAAVIGVGVVGSIVFLVLPFLVGAFTDELGLSRERVGYLGSADMLGMFVAAALATLWVRRFDWRRVAALALAILVGCHLISSLVDGFAPLAAVRALAGFAGGSLMAIALTALGDGRNPDRHFALFISGQLGLGALLLGLIPAVIERFGLDGIFLSLAGVTAVAWGLVSMVPRSGRPTAADRGAQRSSFGLLPGLAALGACFVFNLGVMAVWAYMERIGVAADLPKETIGSALGLSLLAGLGGALLAALLVDRFGRVLPLTLTVALQLVALGLVARGGAIGYAIGAMLFSFCWNFPVAYQLAITVRVDPSARLVVLFLGAVKLGYALGPAAAGLLLVPGGSYAPALWLGSACFVVSGAGYVALARLAVRLATRSPSAALDRSPKEVSS
ncbi:MAG: MFS transporter [Thermoanaerobaculia bacterium]|nr:MFS transporter [Thermoanaerobaculia bacterium]